MLPHPTALRIECWPIERPTAYPRNPKNPDDIASDPWRLATRSSIRCARLQHDPRRLLTFYVREGMTVVEPGCCSVRAKHREKKRIRSTRNRVRRYAALEPLLPLVLSSVHARHTPEVAGSCYETWLIVSSPRQRMPG